MFGATRLSLGSELRFKLIARSILVNELQLLCIIAEGCFLTKLWVKNRWCDYKLLRHLVIRLRAAAHDLINGLLGMHSASLADYVVCCSRLGFPCCLSMPSYLLGIGSDMIHIIMRPNIRSALPHSKHSLLVVVLFRSWFGTNLVDPASSHMLVSKIKPCMSQYKLQYGKTVNGSLKQL